MKRFGLTLLVLLAVVSTLDAQGKKKKNQFEDITSVVVVEVPVNVLKGGEPVRGLTADNFEIMDGRKKVPIVGFDVVDLSLDSPDPIAAATVPPSGRRHFLLLFDLTFSDPAAVVKARTAARELVLNGLHPSDVVAVGTYSSARGARLVLSFTGDRGQVDFALDTLGLIQPAETVRDPLGIIMADLDAYTGVGTDPSGGEAGLDPAAEIFDVLSAVERDTRRQVQTNEILAMSSSLAELAKMMNAVQGRKHVVFLSEGFDSQVLLGTTDQATIQDINESAASGQFWEVKSDERFGDTSATGDVMEMLAEFTKADCTIQAVDIGGLAAGSDVRPRASGQDGLFIMANETGGDFYRNYNDLSDAMSDMLERTSVTYVIAIQPESLKMDGEYHRLKVKLTGGPSGADLNHRPGYYAPRPFSEQSPLERSLAVADMVVSGGDGGRIGLSVLATPFEVNRSQAWVPVLIEIDGPSLTRGFDGDILPAELYAYAIDANGRVGDFFVKSLPLDMKKAGDALRQSGFKYWGEFELPPGDYVARVVVRNSVNGAASVSTRPFKVPEMAQGESTLLPPLFPEPQGKWLLAREEDTADQMYGFDYPFMIQGQPFIPAAKPVLSSSGEASLALVGYNLAEGSLHVVGRLMALDGSQVEGAELVIDERSDTGDPAIEQIAGRLLLSTVPAGEYKLVITVTDTESGSAQESEIPVVVQG
jgi:VWFA-related protein